MKLLTLAVAAGLTLASISSHAYGTNLVLRLRGTGDKFCMDASLDQREKDGDKVYLFKCTDRENQRWAITHDTTGQSVIVGLGGYCVDVRGATAQANNTPIQLWQCHYGKNQRYNLLPSGQIKEVESGKCLIAKGASDRSPVVLDTCMNNDMEKWDTDQ